MSAFDLRPSQRPAPPPTLRSEGLFVDDYEWEPVQEEDEGSEENARLEWDQSVQPVRLTRHVPSLFKCLLLTKWFQTEPVSRVDYPAEGEANEASPNATQASSIGLEPTQRLSEVERMGLFFRE